MERVTGVQLLLFFLLNFCTTNIHRFGFFILVDVARTSMTSLHELRRSRVDDEKIPFFSFVKHVTTRGTKKINSNYPKLFFNTHDAKLFASGSSLLPFAETS